MALKETPSALAAWIGVTQLLFVTTWTLYVVYLPQLAAQAGIPKHWVPWILVADQLVFALTDVATGFWLDRVRAGLARVGPWMLGVTAVSCVAFIALPFAGASEVVLLAAIGLWAVTSAALRSPPWVLLSRHAATPSIPWLSTLVLTGTAVGSALAPYLGIALRGVDPRFPFVLSSVTLVATVAGLVVAERRRSADARTEPQPAQTLPPSRLFLALAFLALGIQVHYSLNSASRYLKFAPPAELAYLMPVFWVGFNLLMFSAVRLVKRVGPGDAMVIAAACGTIATLAAAVAPNLPVLLAAQFLAGGCWGAALVAAYTAAVALGRTGREGRFLGTLFAVLAAAAALRIAAVATGAEREAAFSALLPWLPEAAWLAAALLLVAATRASRPG
ncbi:MAG TPA: MFS transporter [Burkholderiales bacterium]|nr:MFS transporter [Burkholderiales bacterium]